MSELGKRVAVAAVGIPTVLALGWFGGWPLGLVLAATAVLGTRELARLAEQTDVRALEGVGAAAAAGLVLLATVEPTFTSFAPPALAVLGGTVAVALLAALARRGPKSAPLGAVAVTVLAPLYLGLPLACVPLLHALPGEGAVRGAGLAALALPLAITWIGDAAAFFAGSAWGTSKLAPTISPNKSWVGFWANVAGGAGAAAAWWWVVSSLGVLPASGGLWVLASTGAVLGCVAVAGDLVESLLKREAGVKDSGTLFPGHGGVLDRVDSLLFTIPSAYLALVLLWGVA